MNTGVLFVASPWAVLLTILKLSQVITLSWWWVLAPLWIPLAVLLSVACVLYGVWAAVAIGSALAKGMVS